jgi:hypothetical protein
VPDPNLVNDESYRHWMPLSDLYTWPHIRYFDDFDDLLRQLDGEGLAEADDADLRRGGDGAADDRLLVPPLGVAADGGEGGGDDTDALSRALERTSAAMRAHNAALRQDLGTQWADVLARMRRGRTPTTP